MDVGPLVIPHAQAAKLVQPGKRALDDPPPPAQARSRARCGASPARARCGEPGDRAESLPRRSRNPPAHSPAAAAVDRVRLKRWKRIHQGQGFLRVVRFAPVRRTARGIPRPSQIR